MEIHVNYLPLKLMVERVNNSKDDSDTSYFYDLMLLGEYLTKIVVSSLISGIINDKDRNRYRALHSIVRADGIGEWSRVLDEVLTGVSSQFLQKEITLHEQKELQTRINDDSWQYQAIRTLTDIFPIIGMDLAKLPAKVQGRQWFAYFAQLRNATKGHGALHPSACSDACGGLERSIALIINNFYLFKREWAYLHQNMNGKYRVTKLSQSAINFEELKSITRHQTVYRNGLFTYFDERTHNELIQSNADCLDFYLPNGNFKEKDYELLSYISNSRQKGDSTLYLIPANELPESETQGLKLLEVQGNCFGNIPPISKDYIVRQELENDLFKILSEDDRYPIVTLVGRGGIGKTSLALSVLHNIATTSRFDLILWFSSRDIDLKIEGPKAVKNGLLSEQDMADEFVKLIGNIEAKKSIEKIDFLASELTKSQSGRILFVLDNFETVQNPTQLFAWIDTYIRNPNKVLITSRINKSFKADYPIEIHGMSELECHELIAKTAESLNIQTLLTADVKEKIIEEAQGHPYVIKILLGQIAKQGRVSDIERIMANQEDILTALFRRTYISLSPNSQRVFLTLCSWRSIVPLVALEAVLLREENQERINVEDAIDELKKTSFIDIISAPDDSHKFISVPLAAFLFGKDELEVSPSKLSILSDRVLLQEFGAAQQVDIQGGLRPRIERKFRAIANKISNGESIKSHLPTLEFLCRNFPFAWNLLYQLHYDNYNYPSAQEALREYLKTTLTNEEKKITLTKLASLYKSTGDYFAEVNSLTEISILPNTTLEEISDIANVINNYLSSDFFVQSKLQLDTEIKESLVRKVAEIMNRKIKASTFSTATDFSRLAWLYLHLKESDNANEAIMNGLVKDFNNHYCRKLAQKFNLI